MKRLVSRPATMMLATLMGGTALLGPSPAFAQGAAINEGEASDIVVTARRKEESLIEVPISITVMSAEEIRERNATRIRDLGNFVPNVAFLGVEGNGTTTLSVRGVTSQSRINVGFESGIGVYVDGVLVGRQIGFNQEVYDIARVEFLRGPQGTLFGKNTITGAINVVTREPSDELKADLELSYASYNEIQARGYVSAPIVAGKAALSVSGYYLKRDGFQRNLFDGSDVWNEDSRGARAKLLLTPTETLRITFAADTLDEANVTPGPVVTSGYGFVPGNTRNTNENVPALSNRHVDGVSATIELETGFGATLTSITAYRELKSDRDNDTDAGPADVVASFITNEQDQFSQELRLDSTGTGRFGYVAGVFYYDSTVSSSSESCFGRIPNVPGFLRGLCGSTFGDINTKSMAMFGNVDFRVVETLTLTAGLRYTIEDKRLAFEQIGFPFIAPSLPLSTDRLSESDLSPTFTIRWQPNTDMSVYATASRGFKSGGWNVDNVTSFAIRSFADLQFGSESMWNYELGFRASLLDRKLNLSGAVFQMDYSDLQVSKLEPVLGGGGALVAVTSNAGEARIRGFEAEAAVTPLPGLQLSGGVGYADAKYTDYADTIRVGGVLTPVNFAGNKLNGAPEWTVNASVQFETPVSEGLELSSRLDFSHISSFFITRENTAALSIPSRSLFNGQIGVKDREGKWDLFLFGQNLFDKKYIVARGGGGFAFPGIGLSTVESYGAPRSIGVRGTVHF